MPMATYRSLVYLPPALAITSTCGNLNLGVKDDTSPSLSTDMGVWRGSLACQITWPSKGIPEEMREMRVREESLVDNVEGKFQLHLSCIEARVSDNC